jgi:two-component system, chemotaxis family, protein-glutamate methylesterase/glutaminase
MVFPLYSPLTLDTIVPDAGETCEAMAHKYELIAVAASAGGLAAVSELLRALPASLDLPVVIVQHRAATSPPQVLPHILSRAAQGRRVKQAEDGEPLEPNTVYVAPANFHLLLDERRTLHLSDGRRIKYLRSSANPLLESAARALDGRVIAVVLTGSGTDATDGVQEVRSRGGTVIAQDPTQAEHPSMPTAAIQSGAVDYILPLQEIGPMLVQLTGTGVTLP